MAKLGECFSVIRNGASIRQTDGAGGFPITRIETIADRTINREKFGYAGIYDLAQYRDYILQDGDILMSHINSEKHLGKVALYSKQDDEQIIHGMNLLMLRADTQKVIPEYAKYYFESQKFLRQIGRITKKSVNQASFTVTALKELEIPLASIIVQRDISEKLKKVDWLVSLRKQQIAKLDELVKARFVEMFGDISNDKKVLMEEVCKIITDGTHQPPKFVLSGIPFLFVSNIVTNEIHYDAEKFISEETYNELIKRTPIEVGDILLSTVGSYGHPAIVRKNKPFCFQRHIAYLKPNSSVINGEYLRCAILSADVQRQIDERVKGIAQKTLNLSEIRKIQIPLPPLSLQNQFAAFVERVNQQKQTVQQSLEKLELMKKALMQEYFG